MRRSLVLAIAAVSLAAPVAANHPGFSHIPSEPHYIADPLAHIYAGGPRYTATEVLARLRSVCSSNDTSNKRACSRAMAVLKRGHAELRERRAVENAVAD